MFNSKKGFTLIELLVVIAIIALLLSILLPSLNKVKALAKTLVCATHLKNYGTALHTYAVENSDKAPFMKSWLYSQETINNSPIPQECRWHENSEEPDGSLWPYLADKDVHMCPTFASFSSQLGAGGCPNASLHARNTGFVPNYSYSMNLFLGFDWHKYMTMTKPVSGKTKYEVMCDKESSLKLSRVNRPATCMAFSEENLWTIGVAEWDGGRGTKTYNAVVLNDNSLWLNANKNKQDGATDNIATFHNVSPAKRNDGVANIIFVDGHAEKTRGVSGREAYETYGKPYKGHDSVNIW